MRNSSPSSVQAAIDAIQSGQMVIVVDDQTRENEGDLVMAAAKVTPPDINFMIRFGRGLICVPLPGSRLQALSLPPMIDSPEDSMHTDFSLSVDAREGTTTGISAFDRAATIARLADPASRPRDFLRPGHVFPLRAKPGGVLERPGHTEASLDLVRLAGLPPAAVICEILRDDGTMARWDDLLAFARKHDLAMITIADLIQYRTRQETLVLREGSTRLPTRHGTFQTYAYGERFNPVTHLALVLGDPVSPDAPPMLARIHSECLTGDVFGSYRCDCGDQLQAALTRIQGEGRGVLLYLRQEGRGIGLANKIKAYSLQEHGYDTVSANHALGFPADLRTYDVAAQILLDLGIDRVRLLTNNPNKVAELQRQGLDVAERIPLQTTIRRENARYLETKRTLMGHWLDLDPSAVPVAADQDDTEDAAGRSQHG